MCMWKVQGFWILAERKMSRLFQKLQFHAALLACYGENLPVAWCLEFCYENAVFRVNITWRYFVPWKAVENKQWEASIASISLLTIIILSQVILPKDSLWGQSIAYLLANHAEVSRGDSLEYSHQHCQDFISDPPLPHRHCSKTDYAWLACQKLCQVLFFF